MNHEDIWNANTAPEGAKGIESFTLEGMLL